MSWLAIGDKLFPYSSNIPAEVEIQLPDPEHPERHHHTPCQIAWRRQIISRLYFNRLVDKTTDSLKHRYTKTKEEEDKRKQRWKQVRMTQGPPKRPPGIFVPNDIVWKQMTQRFHSKGKCQDDIEDIGITE